ncbi:hypothetical protein IFM89_021397 [Coptis chinensis]|uniref:Uncharacterized protein n=1 Tax=Coptis chinensis TaxID=261450 RepID=A0A835IEJ0_9MAGN|nr:hypothetical protein IFM89_021397 [Coptis chinensis]
MTSNVASNGTREGQPRSSYRPFKSFLNETESLISKEATCSKSIVRIDKGRMGGYGYKESLLQFVEGLGPTANKVAQQKIQECIIPPPNTDFQATHHKVIRPQPTTDLNFLGDDGQLESDDGCQQARCSATRTSKPAKVSTLLSGRLAMESFWLGRQVALFRKGRPTSSIQVMVRYFQIKEKMLTASTAAWEPYKAQEDVVATSQ